jgi:hypothetical protein
MYVYLYYCLSFLIMSFTNLFIYDALLKYYACQSLVDGLVCSVQGKGSRGLKFLAAVPGPGGRIHSQQLQEIQHKRESRRRLLAILNESASGGRS